METHPTEIILDGKIKTNPPQKPGKITYEKEITSIITYAWPLESVRPNGAQTWFMFGSQLYLINPNLQDVRLKCLNLKLNGKYLDCVCLLL